MPDSSPVSGSSWKRTAGICLVLFLVSAALRVLFLLEYSDSPTFSVPIIDSASYDKVARDLALEHRLDPEFFWHGFLYPAMLSAVYAVTDGSVTAARFLQAILAGLTAVSVFFLGRKLFDERTGTLAGLLAASYGPLIFFDTEILSTGLASFLAPLLVLAALYAKGEVNPVRYLLFGLCAGLAIVTRGTFLPFVFFAFILLAFALRARWLPWKSIALREVLVLAGVIAVILPVAVISEIKTGHFSPLPRSGSINFYIGNNPDTDRTMSIRPGAQWRHLLEMPVREGYTTEKEYRGYFTERVTEYAASSPGSFISGLASKTLQLLSSRELPRTYDLYAAAGYSRLLSVSTWKVWKFGFPFGVLLPFAVYGLYLYRRRYPPLFWFFIVFYPMAVILVFSASRLRAPLIPVLAVPAAAGVMAFAGQFRNRQYRRGIAVAAALALIAVATSMYGPYVTEDYDYAAEMYACAGYQLSISGRPDEAITDLESALSISPGYGPAHRILGCILQEHGREEEALDHFEIALRDDPDAYVVHYYMGVALLNHGRVEEGVEHLRKAAEGARRKRDKMLLVQVRNILGND